MRKHNNKFVSFNSSDLFCAGFALDLERPKRDFRQDRQVDFYFGFALNIFINSLFYFAN